MAPRANWKGQLKIDQLVCPVALYTAASTSDRVSFHLLNRKTGNRLQREYVDSNTGKPVAREEQLKGYEISSGKYVSFDDEEIAAAVPESDKSINVLRFIKCDEIDDVYLDRPYYLSPSSDDDEGFALIREGMRAEKVAAIAEAVLFRRARKLLIRSYDEGLVATTLNFDYEVRSAKDVFSDLSEYKFDREMLDLARHIIETKRGEFEPENFDDRYDAALAELIKAKIDGKPLKKQRPAETAKVIDLKEALRKSAGLSDKKKSTKKAATKKPAKRSSTTRKAS